jgi:SAM-dependent methyltransferase
MARPPRVLRKAIWAISRMLHGRLRATAPPAMLARLFDTTLVDLGDGQSKLTDIFCPEPEVGRQKLGITEQFLGNAEAYAEKYSNPSHFLGLFRTAMDEAVIVPAAGATILDIGTGSGTNTIQPLLRTFENCRIVAADLSPDLLRMLRRYVVDQRLQERVFCVCTDAMNNHFHPASFDVVVGAAILHHLIDPGIALKAVWRALKPGGVAFFFEPFEGAEILRAAFELIMQRNRYEKTQLNPAAAGLLEALIHDYTVRSGTDKSPPHFLRMDDKWLFTRVHMSKMAKRAGFSSATFIPHACHATSYQDFVREILRLGANLEAAALPPWAWDLLAMFDNAYSSDMKGDLMIEGTIVVRKSSGPVAIDGQAELPLADVCPVT